MHVMRGHAAPTEPFRPDDAVLGDAAPGALSPGDGGPGYVVPGA